MNPTNNFELCLRLSLGLAAAAVLTVAVPSYRAVRKGVEACSLGQDAKDLRVAENRMKAQGKTSPGATVTYADLSPYLPGKAELKARGGKDPYGNPWGPFVVGQPIRPSADTVQRSALFVPPSCWDLGE